MTLYHGSNVDVVAPDLLHSRPNVDFGKGFGRYAFGQRNH